MEEFTVQIMLTEACDFRCKYCYESCKGYQKKSTDISKKFLKHVENIFDRFAPDKSTVRHIELWGGEPLLEIDNIAKILHHFKKGYQFHMTSNGVSVYKNRHRIKQWLKIYDLHLNISFDGFELQKKYRDKTDEVYKSIIWMIENNQPFKIKSVAPVDDMDLVIQSAKDIAELNEKYNLDLRYNPSFVCNKDFDEQEIISKMEELVCLDIEYYQRTGKFLTAIFDNTWGHATCATGKYNVYVSCDWKIYPCHVALFNGVDPICHLTDSDCFEKIEAFSYEISEPIDPCFDCEVLTCHRCKCDAYVNSKKEAFERFHDYPSVSYQCKFYQTIDVVIKAYNHIKENYV